MTPEGVAVLSPCMCSGIGTVIGLIVQDCLRTTSYTSIIAGSSSGGALGCLICIGMCIKMSRESISIENNLSPIATVVQGHVPVIQNIYLVYTTGAPKNLI